MRATREPCEPSLLAMSNFFRREQGEKIPIRPPLALCPIDQLAPDAEAVDHVVRACPVCGAALRYDLDAAKSSDYGRTSMDDDAVEAVEGDDAGALDGGFGEIEADEAVGDPFLSSRADDDEEDDDSDEDDAPLITCPACDRNIQSVGGFVHVSLPSLSVAVVDARCAIEPACGTQAARTPATSARTTARRTAGFLIGKGTIAIGNPPGRNDVKLSRPEGRMLGTLVSVCGHSLAIFGGCLLFQHTFANGTNQTTGSGRTDLPPLLQNRRVFLSRFGYGFLTAGFTLQMVGTLTSGVFGL
jgi:hypothetical protein